MCKALERSLRGHGFPGAHLHVGRGKYLDGARHGRSTVHRGRHQHARAGWRGHASDRARGRPTTVGRRSSSPVAWTFRTAVIAMKEGALDLLEKPVRRGGCSSGRFSARSTAPSCCAPRGASSPPSGARSISSRRAKAEVCALVASGRRNKQIAALIGTTEKTVKVHRARVMHTSSACSRSRRLVRPRGSRARRHDLRVCHRMRTGAASIVRRPRSG